MSRPPGSACPVPLPPAGATLVDQLEAPIPGIPGLNQPCCDLLLLDRDDKAADPAVAKREADNAERTARRLHIPVRCRGDAVDVRGRAARRVHADGTASVLGGALWTCG